MSRRAERAWAFGATGVLVDLITVPSGEKFELTDWSVSGAGAAGSGYLLMYDAVAAANFFLDQLNLAATDYVKHSAWSDGVIEGGNKIQILWIGGAGTGGVHQVSYVRVSPA